MMANVSRTFLPGIALVALAFAMPATAGTTAPTAPAAFSRCLVCHNAAKGAADKIGPNLWGIFDRKAAHAARSPCTSRTASMRAAPRARGSIPSRAR